MIYYRKKAGLSIADVWYETSTPSATHCDIIRYHYIPELPRSCASSESLFTILIDLSQSEDELAAALDKTTRYQANRAKERDNVRIETFLDSGEKSEQKLDSYIAFFNEFASSKDRGTISRADLLQFFESGTLCVRAVISNETGETLAMHANVVSDGRARLHQSASHFRGSDDSAARSLIGRANRYLHLDDLFFFKKQGLSYYDFGGWYGGDSDKEKLAINAFKEAFGGVKTPEYSCVVPVSFAGRLSVLARKLLRGK